MRVSRIQAEENRQAVIDAASRLFRRHGFDGIGLKDLMAGAGLTQGAFYKQFASKSDLAVQASARALDLSVARWTSIAATRPDDPLAALLGFYLSEGHRDEIAEGCPIVALGSDAARQSPEVKASFEAGLTRILTLLQEWMATDAGAELGADAGISADADAGAGGYAGASGSADTEPGAGIEPGGRGEHKAMAALSTMVGAVLLSRSVNDEALSRRFLQAAADSITADRADARAPHDPDEDDLQPRT